MLLIVKDLTLGEKYEMATQPKMGSAAGLYSIINCVFRTEMVPNAGTLKVYSY